MCMHESLLDVLRFLRVVFFGGGYKLTLPCSQIHMTLVDGLQEQYIYILDTYV